MKPIHDSTTDFIVSILTTGSRRRVGAFDVCFFLKLFIVGGSVSILESVGAAFPTLFSFSSYQAMISMYIEAVPTLDIHVHRGCPHSQMPNWFMNTYLPPLNFILDLPAFDVVAACGDFFLAHIYLLSSKKNSKDRFEKPKRKF